MPLILIFFSFLIPLPAVAQFYPSSAGLRYCKLRELGLDYNNALHIAISENRAPHRNTSMVTYAGSRVTIDTAEFVDYVRRVCPLYLHKD